MADQNPQPSKLILDTDWKKRDEPAKPAAPAAPASAKLEVDSDWKSQAQAEKERLAQQESARAEKAAASGATAGPAGQRGKREMPPADFAGLVGSLATQALMYMGAFPDPQTGRAIVSLEYARFHIDLLGVLEEKTRNNISAEESKDLTSVLHELRLRYVEITQAVAQMMKEQAEGKLNAAAGGMPGGAIGGPMGGGIGGPGTPGLR